MGKETKPKNPVMFGRSNPSWQHGMYKSSEYAIWAAIIQRCLNPNNKYYYNYGGRGIMVCEAWRSFRGFIEDVGQRPTSKHTLERLDNNGNYEPSNCEWKTRAEQSRNTRRTVMLTFEGRTMCMADWAAEKGMKRITLYTRLRTCGWSVRRALTTPVRIN